MLRVGFVDSATKVCVNIAVYGCAIEDIKPPEGCFVIPLDTTPTLNWVWSGSDWGEVEAVGNLGIGATWDGKRLVAPKPTSAPQEKTNGVQTL